MSRVSQSELASPRRSFGPSQPCIGRAWRYLLYAPTIPAWVPDSVYTGLSSPDFGTSHLAQRTMPTWSTRGDKFWLRQEEATWVRMQPTCLGRIRKVQLPPSSRGHRSLSGLLTWAKLQSRREDWPKTVRMRFIT